jgi:rubrerythrin
MPLLYRLQRHLWGLRRDVEHCPECGWEVDPDEEMCPNCGAYLADYEDSEHPEE